MNRRKFFGMTLAGLAAAGLPAILMPEKTLFLPPKYGWKPHLIGDFQMREVCQYLINLDELLSWRYDAIGRDIWGTDHQLYVDMRHDVPVEQRLELARTVIGNQFERDGLAALKIGESTRFKLELPRTSLVRPGRYV
jgi:hypothetical protein